MTRSSFHYTNISADTKSASMLRLIRDEILKPASGPMTQLEVADACERIGVKTINHGPKMGEIGANEGHEVVCARFPDGKYRYWIINAPDWSPRWRVNIKFEIVPVTSSDPSYAPEKLPGISPTDEGRETMDDVRSEPQPRRCMACGKDLPQGGTSFCSEECKNAFFKIPAQKA